MQGNGMFSEYDAYDPEEIVQAAMTVKVGATVVGWMVDGFIEDRLVWWEEFREYFGERCEDFLTIYDDD